MPQYYVYTILQKRKGYNITENYSSELQLKQFIYKLEKDSTRYILTILDWSKHTRSSSITGSPGSQQSPRGQVIIVSELHHKFENTWKQIRLLSRWETWKKKNRNLLK